MPVPPSRQCPAAISRVTTSRTWVAVTPVASSAGLRRTASSGSVQLVRPGSMQTLTEIGVEKNTTIVFPLPIELMQLINRLAPTAKAALEKP